MIRWGLRLQNRMFSRNHVRSTSYDCSNHMISQREICDESLVIVCIIGWCISDHASIRIAYLTMHLMIAYLTMHPMIAYMTMHPTGLHICWPCIPWLHSWSIDHASINCISDHASPWLCIVWLCIPELHDLTTHPIIAYLTMHLMYCISDHASHDCISDQLHAHDLHIWPCIQQLHICWPCIPWLRIWPCIHQYAYLTMHAND